MLITGNAIPKDQLDLEKVLCLTAIADDVINSEYVTDDRIIKVAYSDTVTGSVTYSYLNVTQETVLTVAPATADVQQCDSGVDVELEALFLTDTDTGSITDVLSHKIFDKKTGALLSTLLTLTDGTTAVVLPANYYLGKEAKRVVLGDELIALNNVTAVALTVPANTRGAHIQVHAGSDAKVSVSGTTPVASYTGAGNVVSQGQTVILNSAQEVEDFLAIAISGTGELYVEFFNTSVETGI